MQGNYSVRIEEYAQGHFIKSFERKYKNHWETTRDKVIIFALERIDSLIRTDKAETISDVDGVKIIKTKFALLKSGESAKSSGNRCIVAWHESEQLVRILLVYSKTDLSGHNETEEWKRLIRENYPEYKDHCK